MGLKHDLEKCLRLWQETGTIEWFELGERDKCDRFLIPEKLYGRENEVQTLLAAFHRVANGTCELMLVAGFSGIGKTAVINEVHKPIVRQRGYFIKGKFDQFQRNIPFSAFVQAFRDLMGQLLGESDAQLEIWKTKILTALGENGQVIIEVIPELERIIGKQPPVPELSGSASQNRFNLLFQKFIQVFTTADHPLVIFVDDLQWADSASLKLMQLLMSDSHKGYLLLLGAYRDNEVFPAHPLMLTLDEISKSGATIDTITLAPLSLGDLNRLVADTLTCELELALPLTELVHQKTKGNPFFATQFLKGLHEDGWITFNQDEGYWLCNMTGVRELALTDNVVEFMADRLYKLPEKTQQTLKLAACIGNQFNLTTLAIACEQPSEDVATALWGALQEGFILPVSDSYKFFQQIDYQELEHPENVQVSYKFLHDRVQQAAYSLIPEEQKQATHLQIARLLWQNLSPQERQIHLFIIVNHYNQAIDALWQQKERDNLMELNVAAGQKAKASAAYEAAWQYYQTALSLLPRNSWQQNYSLALKLHEANAEAAYLTGNFAKMDTLIDRILSQAKNVLDRVKAHEIKIQAHMAQSHLLEALNTGVEFLALLGIEVPESPQPEDLQVEIAAISQAMTGKTIADLAQLPLMEDANSLAKVKILANILSPCYQGKPSLFFWVVCKLMQLLIEYGNTPPCPFIYACYGMICIVALQDVASAGEYGKLACQLDFNPQTGDRASGIYVAGACLIHCSTHVREALPLLLKAYQAGLETGNFQHGGYALSNRTQYLYLMGYNLCALKQEMVTTKQALANLKQGNTLAWNQPSEQAVLNLLGESAVPWELVGTAYDETQSLPLQLAANKRTELHYVYLNQLILCYLFDRLPQAVENAARAKSYVDGVVCFLDEYTCNFYNSLAQLAYYDRAIASVQENILERVRANQVTMQQWATHSPMNARHKYDLVAAELHRVLGERLEAMELYDRAIAGAAEHEYIQEESLANELAAKFYLNWGLDCAQPNGKEKIASVYMQQAYYGYSRWGAKAKVEDLEKRYPTLLESILERQKLGLIPSVTLATLTKGTVSRTTAGTGEILDLATLMKASRTLSQTIELQGAIANLMQVVKENAGAETVALMLLTEQVLMLTAKIQGEEVFKLAPIPVENSNAVPLTIVNKVKHCQQPLLLENASQDADFCGDAYIQNHQPQSILCLPLVDRGQLRGILYLENNQVAGAFTGDRLDILNLLCSQAAISLENAQLYQRSQQALKDLQQAQLQLVQSEKMAALGNLVAGVGHEINNPLGFICGNINVAQKNLQDLLNALDLYQQKYPSPDAELTEELEALDLDFIVEDFPKLIASMQLGVERIRQISISLRTFSRKDTETQTAYNLHEGLDSTLLILKYRLKANEHRPAIEIIKDYGDLPEIQCYPGQINQVFMNLFANAIDALEESRSGFSLQEIVDNPQQIHIKTEANVKEVIVRISDNGKGMSQEVLARLFEQGFTTKGVGKGTGLGMAISRQIVEEKHGGAIACLSELGNGTEFIISLPLA